MYKYLYIFLGLFLFFSCQESENKRQDPEMSNPIVEKGMNISEIITNNRNIEIDYPKILRIDEEINCTGTIEIPPSSIYSNHPKISGNIVSIHVQAGQKIKKGSLLFMLSDPQLIEKQRVFLESREKYLLAKKDFERKNSLISKNAISGTEYDIAEGNLKEMSVNYQGLKSELQMIGFNVEKLENDSEFQLTLPVYAQAGGTVEEVFVNLGQRVSPETLMAKISNINNAYLELRVLAKEIHLIQIGQEVEFLLPEIQKTMKAKINKLSPVIDEAKGSMKVYCDIEKSDLSQIISGMFVNAKIQAGSREVKSLPPTAYLKEGTNYFGFRVKGEILEKTDLGQYEFYNNHIILPENFNQKMVIKGAYYIE